MKGSNFLFPGLSQKDQISLVGLLPRFGSTAHFSWGDSGAKKKNTLLQKQPSLSLYLVLFVSSFSFSASSSSSVSSSSSSFLFLSLSLFFLSLSLLSFSLSSSSSFSLFLSLSLFLFLFISLQTFNQKLEMQKVTQSTCWTPLTTSITHATSSWTNKTCYLDFICHQLKSLFKCRIAS